MDLHSDAIEEPAPDSDLGLPKLQTFVTKMYVSPLLYATVTVNLLDMHRIHKKRGCKRVYSTHMARLY